jgi:predicted transcriptional regulator
MGSQIYSIVVRDEVMEPLDTLARGRGASRSQMINEILAGYFDLVTPQTKINLVMDQIEEIIQEVSGWQFLSKAKGSSIQCRTSIGYKYNPKVRFILELTGKDQNRLATLKIVSRTQNPIFYQHLIRFFGLIEEIETYDPTGFRLYSIKRGMFENQGNRFIRDFYYDWMHENLEVDHIAYFLSNYMKMINEAMNTYFKAPELENELLLKRLYLVYRKYI